MEEPNHTSNFTLLRTLRYTTLSQGFPVRQNSRGLVLIRTSWNSMTEEDRPGFGGEYMTLFVPDLREVPGRGDWKPLFWNVRRTLRSGFWRPKGCDGRRGRGPGFHWSLSYPYTCFQNFLERVLVKRVNGKFRNIVLVNSPGTFVPLLTPRTSGLGLTQDVHLITDHTSWSFPTDPVETRLWEARQGKQGPFSSR